MKTETEDLILYGGLVLAAYWWYSHQGTPATSIASLPTSPARPGSLSTIQEILTEAPPMMYDVAGL